MAKISQASYDRIVKEAAAKWISAEKVASVASSRWISVAPAQTPTTTTTAPTAAAVTTMTPVQPAVTSQIPTADPKTIQQINQQTAGTQKVTAAPWSVTGITSTLQPKTSEKIVAPNWKEYTLFSDWTQTWFDWWFGTKPFQTRDAAIAEITAQNPAGSAYSKWIGSGEVTWQIKTQADLLKTDLANLKQEWLEWQQQLQQRLTNLDPQEIERQYAEIVNRWTLEAKNALVSARQLAGEAEIIFGEWQIKAQQSDMVKRWLDPAKAWQAALFLNLKWRSNLMAKVKQIQSEFDKQISNLEMQKAQLLMVAKDKWIEAEKWVQDKAQSIENSIQNIRNDYQQNVWWLVEKYTIQPMLNVQSATMAQEAQNVAQDIQRNYDTSTPERKIAWLYRIFGEQFAYVGNDIMNFTNLPFEQLVIKAAEMIKNNMKK